MKLTHSYYSQIIILFFTFTTDAFALNPIIRSYQSVRSAGMGNVRYTTGLYEENFHANPARVTANPANLLQLPKLSLEAGQGSINAIKDVTNSTGGLQPFADNIGKPISARVQMVFPAFYKKHFLADFWAFGIGFLASSQSVLQLGQNGVVDPTTVVTAGPAITLGRRLLDEDRLSVGATLRTELRASSSDTFSVTDFLKGNSIKQTLNGGNGLGIDGDLGATYRPHWTWLKSDYQLALAINNVAGGRYKNLGNPLKNWPSDPIESPRSYNFGISAFRDEMPILNSLEVALEVTDIGNNKNGSIYKLIHLGTEAKWKILAGRFGINQGYLCGGLGIDLKFFQMNFATYGEELGLNVGTIEDRRYAVDIGFQI